MKSDQNSIPSSDPVNNLTITHLNADSGLVPDPEKKILCKEVLQEIITVDENDYHSISREQLTAHLTLSIADAFLVFMNQFPPEYQSPMLKMIKNGEITISCTDS